MKRSRWLCPLAVIAACVFCMAALGGCSRASNRGPTEEDAKAFVKASLDLLCRGEYDDSTVDIVDGGYSVEDVREDVVRELKEAMSEEGVPVSDEFSQRFGEAVVSVLKDAHYTVTGAAATDAGFTVLVDIEPISATHCMSDRELAYPRMSRVCDMMLTDADEEAILNEYYISVLELIELSVADPVYREAVTRTVRVFVNDDGVLDVEESDAQALGEVMISYDDADWEALSDIWDEAEAALEDQLAAIAVEQAEELMGVYTGSAWENTWFGMGLAEKDGWSLDPDYARSERQAVLAYYDGDSDAERLAAALADGELVDVLSADCDDPYLTIEGYLLAKAVGAEDEESALRSFYDVYAEEAQSAALSTGEFAGSSHMCLDLEEYFEEAGTTICMRIYIIGQGGYFLFVTVQGLDWDDVAGADPFYTLTGDEESLASRVRASAQGDEIILSDGDHSVAIRLQDDDVLNVSEDDYISSAKETDDALRYTYYSFWLYDTVDDILDGEIEYGYQYLEDDEDFSELTRSELASVEIDGKEIFYVTFTYMMFDQFPCRDLYILYPTSGGYFLIERDRVETEAPFPQPEDDVRIIVQGVREP